MKLAPRKYKHFQISLSNTCAVDALVHLIATTYCDCEKFRGFADKSNSALYKLAVHIVREGTNAAAYQIRAEMLYNEIKERQEKITPGLVHVDCASTPDALLQILQVPPSVNDLTSCSSPFCPKPGQVQHVPFLSANINVLKEGGISRLEKAVEANNTSATSRCLHPFASDMPDSVPLIPEVVTNFLIDRSYSKNILCAGLVTHVYEPQQAVFISVGGIPVVNAQEDVAGVELRMKCKLSEVPPMLFILNKLYYLRGLLAFTQSPSLGKMQFTNLGVGHFVAFSRRIGAAWYVLDNARTTPVPVADSTEVEIDLMLYSVI